MRTAGGRLNTPATPGRRSLQAKSVARSRAGLASGGHWPERSRWEIRNRLSYDVPLGCKSQLAEGGLAVDDYKEVMPGELTTVENIRPTPCSVPVYNLRIADWHTYFVGSEEWGFSAWAHNADCRKPKPYGDLAGNVPEGFQANHVNQNAAYGSVIPQNDGLAIPMEGNAFTDPGTAAQQAEHGLMPQDPVPDVPGEIHQKPPY